MSNTTQIPDIDNFESLFEKTTNFRKKIIMIQKTARSKDKKFLPILIRLLEQERHNFVVATLVKAVGYLGDEKVIPILNQYLTHKDNRIRANAIEGLEYIHSPKVTPVVVKCLRDPDNRVKANAIKCLNKFGNVEVQKHIEDMIKSRKEENIYSAIFALRVIGNDYAVDRLYKILKDNVSFRIRYRAKNSLIELAVTGNRKASEILQKDDIFLEELFYENIRNLRDKQEFIGRKIVWVGEVRNHFEDSGFYLLKDALCHDWIVLLYKRNNLVESEILEINGKIIGFIDNKYPVIEPEKMARLI